GGGLAVGGGCLRGEPPQKNPLDKLGLPRSRSFFPRAGRWSASHVVMMIGSNDRQSRAIFQRINQPYKAARNRISGYRTATIGMSRTSRRPTSDAIQNGRLCRRNGPAEGRKCANFFFGRARGLAVGDLR